MNMEKENTWRDKSRNIVKGITWLDTLTAHNVLNGLTFL